MTSTSFISGTGFMKCMPITRSERRVRAASTVIEIDDVLLARIAAGGSSWSAVWNTLPLTSRFSVTASTQRSTSRRHCMSVVPISSFFAASARSPGSVPFSTNLPRLLCTVCRPRSRNSCLTSTMKVDTPQVANVWAMPLPMVPAPITATAFGREDVVVMVAGIVVGLAPIGCRGGVTGRSEALDGHHDGVAAAEAEAREAARLAALLQRVQQRGQHTRAGAADRVAERDRAAVHVQALRVDLELLAQRDHLHAERLVQLDQVEVLHAALQQRAQLLGRDLGRHHHPLRCETAGRVAEDARERL